MSKDETPPAPTGLSRETIIKAQVKNLVAKIKDGKVLTSREQELVDQYIEMEGATSGAKGKGPKKMLNGRVNMTWVAAQLGITRPAVMKRIEALQRKKVTVPLEDADALVTVLSSGGKPASLGDAAPVPAGAPTPFTGAGVDFLELPMEEGPEGALQRARYTERALGLMMAKMATAGLVEGLAKLGTAYSQQQIILAMQESNTLKHRVEMGRYVDREVFLDAVAEILAKLREFIDLAPATYASKANPGDPSKAEAALQLLRHDLFENLASSELRVGRIERAQ